MIDREKVIKKAERIKVPKLDEKTIKKLSVEVEKKKVLPDELV